MKYKKGDKVRIRKDLEVGGVYGGWPFDGYMAIYRGGNATITGVKSNYYGLDIDSGRSGWTDKMLEPIEKTWDNLEVGDILVDSYGNRKRVLGVLGELVFLSHIVDQSRYGGAYTLSELKFLGYTVEQTEPEEEILELTLDEVAEKFNVDVSKLKIKKEK